MPGVTEKCYTVDMALIQVKNLTFSYDGSADEVFNGISFNMDSAWKLGFIARNGKGKTTLLNLLMGRYDHGGSIVSGVSFDYFPYAVDPEDLESTADQLIGKWKKGVENWQVMIELNAIGVDTGLLYRPFHSLSHGERTRIMLAVLFASDNEFLLIDEPTNHLDQEARECVKKYLSSKKGFMLVSHDRDLLDAVCDHVLVMNRKTVEIQAGNFSSWWENKEKSDAFALAENEKHMKEIKKLKASADRSSRWAEKSESSKIGFDPLKETDRSISTRSYIGAKTKKMQARVKSYEKRIDREIGEKEGLLQDLETVSDLKICPLIYHKEVLIEAADLSLHYEEGRELFSGLNFKLRRGDRIALNGPNGCGKSSIIKAVLNDPKDTHPVISGTLNVSSGLVISYIDQDTSFLKGALKDYCESSGLDRSLFLTVLRQLDLGREQFVKNMEDFSEGQKKKVLIASSLLAKAHLYIWDEPLNYIDVFSRMQIEKLITNSSPTMLFVEHDKRFQEKIATETINLFSFMC